MLSERERRFVEAYMGEAAGNGTAAARLAGYKGNTDVLKVQAHRLLTKANVQAEIENRAKSDPAVWTREQRQQFWTNVAAGHGEFQDAQLKDRLKAAELLGKSQADFIERHEHSGNVAVDVRGSAERLAGSLASIAARAAKRISGGAQ